MRHLAKPPAASPHLDWRPKLEGLREVERAGDGAADEGGEEGGGHDARDEASLEAGGLRGRQGLVDGVGVPRQPHERRHLRGAKSDGTLQGRSQAEVWACTSGQPPSLGASGMADQPAQSPEGDIACIAW